MTKVLKHLYVICFLLIGPFVDAQNSKVFSLSITVEENIPDSVLIPELEELTVFTKSENFQLSKKLLDLENLKSLSILVENEAYSLPYWIKELKQLEELYIKWSLKEIPDELFDIKGLKALSLIGQFESVPKEIDQLYQLEYLNLSSSELKSIPKSLFKLETIGFLSIVNSQIKSVPYEIQQLKKMEYLDLGNNLLTDIPPLKDCEKLVEVNLHENKISPYQLHLIEKANPDLIIKYDYRFQKFNHIRSYQELRANKENISNDVKVAAQNKKIKILDLSHSENIDRQFQLINKKSSKLQHIEVLKLNGNNLEILPEFISELSHLKEIYLQSNQLSILPSFLNSIENLRVINISDNPFSGFGAQDLQLHQLIKLVVDQDAINSSVIEQFYQFIPNLRIVMK